MPLRWSSQIHFQLTDSLAARETMEPKARSHFLTLIVRDDAYFSLNVIHFQPPRTKYSACKYTFSNSL